MKNAIKTIIQNNVGATVDNADNFDDHLIDDFTFESIINDVEDEFNASIPIPSMDEFENIGDFINYLDGFVS